MTNSKGSPVVVGGATSAEQVVQNAAAGNRAEIDEVSAPGPSKGDGMSERSEGRLISHIV